MLTVERLKELLSYDIGTGLFVWKSNRGRTAKSGWVAGSAHCYTGHIAIRIDGIHYKAHRLAWLYVNGKWPLGHIDHMDGNSANNRLNNLRENANSINSQNQRKPRADNTSGVLGVSHRNGKWRAKIQVDKRQISLGSFSSKADAAAAYLSAKRLLHPGCTI